MPVRVEHDVRRAAALRPGDNDEALIVGAGERPRRVLEAGQVGAPAVFEDRLQGGLDFFLRQDVAEAKLMGPPLADELVGHAAGSDFARHVHVVGQILLEVLAIPAAFDQIRLALEEDVVEAFGGFGVAHPLGPLFAGAEGGEIIARHERRCAVQGFVVGVPLHVFQDAIGLSAGSVAADEILDRPLDVRPIFLKERIVGRIHRFAVGLQDAA